MTRARSWRWCAFAIVVGFAASCGDEPVGTQSVPLDAYCDRIVAVACESLARCGCNELIEGLGETCVMDALLACPLAEGAAVRVGVDNGTVTYDPAAAGRFIDLIATIECDGSDDCGTSDVCIGLSDIGGACGVHYGCVEGTVCIAGQCRATLAVGAPCSEDIECVTGACNGSCVAPGEIGSPCSVDAECASARCDFATGRCAGLIADGELCYEHHECESGYCHEAAMLAAGLCTPRGADGDSCTVNEGCVSGGCVRFGESPVCGSALCATP